ncbi:MAG: hypothetical protein QW057_10790, partial [Candidatus Bathyarchaeia archaeon]
SLNEQVYAVTRAVASLALSEAPVRLVMTMPGIDYYSAMLYVAALGDRDMRLMMQLRKENGLWKIVQSRGDRLPTLTPMRGFIPGTVELTPKLQDVVRVKHCFWLEADGVLWKWYRVGTLEMKLYALAWNGKHVTLKARHSILVGGVAPLSQGNL